MATPCYGPALRTKKLKSPKDHRGTRSNPGLRRRQRLGFSIRSGSLGSRIFAFYLNHVLNRNAEAPPTFRACAHEPLESVKLWDHLNRP